MSLLPYGTTSTAAPVLHHAAWCHKSVIAHGSGPALRAADTKEYTQFGADSWDKVHSWAAQLGLVRAVHHSSWVVGLHREGLAERAPYLRTDTLVFQPYASLNISYSFCGGWAILQKETIQQNIHLTAEANITKKEQDSASQQRLRPLLPGLVLYFPKLSFTVTCTWN